MNDEFSGMLKDVRAVQPLNIFRHDVMLEEVVPKLDPSNVNVDKDVQPLNMFAKSASNFD